MIDLRAIHRHLMGRPAGGANIEGLGAAMNARDTFSRSFTSLARNAALLRDALFPPLARRPVSRILNQAFDLRIAHNSYFDIITHAIFVATCATVVASSIGVAFCLAPQNVELLSLSMAFAWNCLDEDGVLYPAFH